jgi:ubiquinone/menaquinone biosynthesis C-methylase UbiE
VAYIIKGGQQGKERLSVIADALQATTTSLIDRVGSLEGAIVVDAACGGGDVALHLAERVGSGGKIVGLDLDKAKLEIARTEASTRSLANMTFVEANVVDPWPIGEVDLVYARFILTHLAEPARCLNRAMAALKPGGHIVIEDIDYGGRFMDPPCAAITRADELYVEAACRQGGDPFIGRRLHRVLEDAGFTLTHIGVVQPFARSGSAKQTVRLTLAAIADNLVATEIASRQDVDVLLREVEAFTARPDTLISMPRIFQAVAARPR